MKKEVRTLLDQVKDTADFGYVEFNDINATNEMGDNALHCVIVWGDYERAKLLIENGININQSGEHGYTPLHQACSFGHAKLVKLLLEHGANPFARTEGDTPFAIARLAGKNEICDLLTPYMTKADPDPAQKAREEHMKHLERRITELEEQVHKQSADS